MVSDKVIKGMLSKKKDDGIFPKDWVNLVFNNIERTERIQANGDTYTVSKSYIKVYFSPSKKNILSRPINEATIQMLIEAEKRSRIELGKINSISKSSMKIEELIYELKIGLYQLEQLDKEQLNSAMTELLEFINRINA